jgi:hypothetical protein
MKFEDALAQMRLGKKITHKLLGEDVYLMSCYLKLDYKDEKGNLIEDRHPSIVKMKGEYQYEDMQSGKLFDPVCRHGLYPQINLLLLIKDDWEIME